MKPAIVIIGKTCTGKDYFADKNFPLSEKIDIGSIVRRITKQTERVHDVNLDERIVTELFTEINQSKSNVVVITGIRQISILKWLEQVSDVVIFHLIGSELTLKQRFNSRADLKDSKLSFEEILKRDGDLGLDALEQEISTKTQLYHPIYIPMQVTLYKKSKNGKLQQWTIETDSNMFRTIEGYVGGALTPTAWTLCEGKRAGMANATTPEQQAIKEAEAKIQKQRDKGWADTPEEISAAAPKVKPKLAHKYKDHAQYVKTWKVAALMPKLDGIRALPIQPGTDVYSRTGKPIVAAPHLQSELSDLFEGLDGLNIVLDGELYNHDLKYDFNEISSIVRQSKPTEEDLAKSEKLMQYHIFDIMVSGSFAARYAILQTLVKEDYKYLKLVPCVFLPVDENFEAAAQKQYEEWLDEGYEGMMYINAESEYSHNRTKDLLKRKETFDGEFKLVKIEEGRGNKAGMAAKVYCVDERGEEFKAGIIGTEEYCRKLLADKDQHIGKMVTIQYQNLTPDRQVPRFCKMKAIRDYE